MGTFIHVIDKSQGIPEDKHEEFKERVKILFQSGGMMNFQEQCLLGKKIYTISPVDFEDDFIDFTYNYLEDDFWENAGFSLKSFKVYSNKVGWRYFNWVVSAAYILQGLYSNGDFLVVGNLPITYDEKYYIYWINSLFDEKFSWKNWDRFKVLCMIRNRGYDYLFKECLKISEIDYEEADSYEALLSCIEVDILNQGIDDVLDKFVHDKDYYFLKIIKNIEKELQLYKEESTKTENEQIDELLYGVNQVMKEEYKYSKNKNHDERFMNLMCSIFFLSSPVILLKCISDSYDKDFWELFDKIENYHRIGISSTDKPLPAFRLSEILKVNDDDLIFLWKDNGQIQLSNELLAWFDELKLIFNEKAKENIMIENPILWIIDMLQFADDNYAYIFAFSSFFVESLENIHDQNYLILWKIFDEMCHDEDMLNQGKVVFKNNDAKTGMLKTEWLFIKKAERLNSARTKLKRYLALVANKDLRKIVFGF